jgi:hypothetical protein
MENGSKCTPRTRADLRWWHRAVRLAGKAPTYHRGETDPVYARLQMNVAILTSMLERAKADLIALDLNRDRS